ncbi:MAG: efflux RND transporter periplasmic adaptor subunit [Candidatus Thiodiazotropha sp. (ex Notomyrtea botanica)]|nr:efflux RND transporter periplasmic adaptor subunit [Candidatus Thiodiazotropha sp. (ex Notomyrtea botanica)]
MRRKTSTLNTFLVGVLLFSSQLKAQDLSAVTDWYNRVTLTTVSSGMVGKVNVSVGDQVAQGSLLIELDQRKLNARLAAAESRREAAMQVNSEARRELDRSLELYDRTLLSDHERKLAEIEAAKADAAFREAEAKLTAIRLQKEYSRINAPFNGLVAALHVQPGQSVINRLDATPLVTLVENRRMRASAQIDERTLPGLQIGDPVKIGVRGQWLEGEILLLGLDPIATSTNGALYAVEAGFAPAEGMGLRAGEQAVLRLPDE